jgi:DNA polymerase-4
MPNMEGRVVLHSDLNNCYASIECMLHPELRGRYIAVCGSTEDRHGIVLAKNQLAKQCGVKTGEVIWEAKQKCPQLTIVEPHMEQYLKFSKIVRSIYLRYSPEVESFGIDESWIELTGSPLLQQKTPIEIANEIRTTVKEEVGLTVSIGVSFNKIFAKLGSDMKKPDAVTVITGILQRSNLAAPRFRPALCGASNDGKASALRDPYHRRSGPSGSGNANSQAWRQW